MKDQIQEWDKDSGLNESNSVHSSPTTIERHPAIRGVELAIVGYEITPFDDALRYSLLAGMYAATRNPELSALVYGASTTASESLAALAASDLLSSGGGHKFISWINNKLEKQGIPKEAKVGKAAKAITATYLGTPLLLGLKQRENPEREIKENVKYGLGTAAALGGVCLAEGIVITESISVVADGLERLKPKIFLPAVAALGGIKLAVKRATEKLKASRGE
jgi:hypothetical protein